MSLWREKSIANLTRRELDTLEHYERELAYHKSQTHKFSGLRNALICKGRKRGERKETKDGQKTSL